MSKNHASNQGKPLKKMAAVLRFFLFWARNPESVLKLYGPSFSSKEKNAQLVFSKCLVSSFDKNSTSFSKYDSVYRTNVTASLLLKSKKYQEENKMPPSPFRWLICDTTAVVFSLFYTYKKPTLYTEHQ